MRNEQSLLLAVRHQLSALGYTESEIDAQDSAIEHFTKLIVNSIDMEKNQNEVTKYWCEKSCKEGVGIYEFADDINKALEQDNNIKDIILIGTEFINWLTDDSILKGAYHKNRETGEMYQDRDDAHILKSVPITEIETAITQLKNNENVEAAKNVIYNIITRTCSYLD